jgi:hypothetical protein
MMQCQSVIWKRLDDSGMDACRYRQQADGWIVEGSAVFTVHREITRLSYRLHCDREWNSVSANVRGWVGKRDIAIDLRRTCEGGWSVNDRPIHNVDGLLDVDLGFTPATNTNAIRRMRIVIGREIENTAVWLDTADWRIKPLTQIYERRSATTYAYASPLHGYSAILEVDDFGLVVAYPDLWEAVRVEDC